MNLDKLNRIDLNLLVILQVLFEEQSVTRAANRLHVSQSAISKNLNRLREVLEDPLFIRQSHGLKPTYHAMYLSQKLPGVLQQLSALITPPNFDPQNSHRHFSIAMVESAYETLLPHFIGDLLSQAPHIHLDTHFWTGEGIFKLAQGEIDFAITGRDIPKQIKETSEGIQLELTDLPPGIEYQMLYQDKQVCLVRHDHPAIKWYQSNQWELEQYLALEHVQVRCEGNPWWALDYFLSDLGVGRKISTTVPDFYGAANVSVHSDLIFTLPSSFAKHAQKLYPLTQLPLPFEFMPMAYVLFWHQRNNQDLGHQWLKNIMVSRIQASREIINLETLR